MALGIASSVATMPEVHGRVLRAACMLLRNRGSDGHQETPSVEVDLW